MQVFRGLCLSVALATSGCLFVAEDDDPPLGSVAGTLVVDWTIDGYKDPRDCELTQVDSVSIVLETVYGEFAGEFVQVCESFATSIRLYPDDYVGDVVLLDAFGTERTTPVRVRPFSIFSRESLVIPIDFPASSFY